jgi:hypothetical protein
MLSQPQSDRRFWTIIIATAATILALQSWLVFNKAVNWDEFFHFQFIHQLRSGTMTQALQIFYIHYFSWLADLPILPIDQLLIGRLVLLLCEPIIAAAIFGLASQFASRATAVLCVLTYVTGGYIFTHIFAFRPDAQTTALLMSALWLFSARKLSWPVMTVIAFIIALAGMLTIKSIFYAPCFAGLVYLRLKRAEEPRRFVARCAAIMAMIIPFFTGLFFLHGASLASDPVDTGKGVLVTAGNTVFSEGMFPQLFFLMQQVGYAPILTVALAISPFLWRSRVSSRAEWIALAGFLLPVATVCFYRNSYPYNFVFILAPAAVTIFPVVELFVSRIGVPLFCAALMIQPVLMTIATPRETLQVQRAIGTAVRQIFPQPVTYIDFCGMIGDMPRAFPFLMSGWGLSRYNAAGQPWLRQAMARQPVPLVIDNYRVLDAALHGREINERLLPEDIEALRSNFIHHWGPIWVAGKTVDPGRQLIAVNITVPGIYTVEGAPISVNGRAIGKGETVRLSRGEHGIVPHPERVATLRWGERLPMPGQPPPTLPYFVTY